MASASRQNGACRELIPLMSRILLPYERGAVEERIHKPDPRQVARLYAATLERLAFLDGSLTLEAFARAVTRGITYPFRDTPPEPSALSSYVDSLHIDDLALAAACKTGDERAWKHVIGSYRPILYRAARVMTGDDAAGRELADTLWAELYGVGRTAASLASDDRRSLLAYFHGRSTLATWLRAVLARLHVDLIRARQRDEPLDQEKASGEPAPSQGGRATARALEAPEPTDHDQGRYASAYRQALDTAVEQLEPGDRLRLSYYYVQELTLAEIGRLVGEHEATASRKLKRVRASIRGAIERSLREEHKLTQAEIELCYQYIIDDRSIDLARLLGP